MRLDDRVAIVTGGAQGIGGATARRLAEQGARVLIADIDMEVGESNVATIRRAGGTVDLVRADVGKAQDIEAMVRKAVDLWGRLDILVNNAFDAGSAGNRRRRGCHRRGLGPRYGHPRQVHLSGGETRSTSDAEGRWR